MSSAEAVRIVDGTDLVRALCVRQDGEPAHLVELTAPFAVPLYFIETCDTLYRIGAVAADRMYAVTAAHQVLRALNRFHGRETETMGQLFIPDGAALQWLHCSDVWNTDFGPLWSDVRHRTRRVDGGCLHNAMSDWGLAHFGTPAGRLLLSWVAIYPRSSDIIIGGHLTLLADSSLLNELGIAETLASIAAEADAARLQEMARRRRA